MCKRTWTIRPKKRGRPIIRILPKVLLQVFLEKYTLLHLAKRRPHVQLLTFRHRFRQALLRFINRPSSLNVPPESLVLLADGLWFQFNNKPWVLYLTALKPCSGNVAIFMDPILLSGQEGSERWQKVFAAIPAEPRSRIKALVVDNLQGMKRIAHKEKWILQLCHFHLILKLQVQRTHARRALKGGIIRETIYRMICQALETPDKMKLNSLLKKLDHMAYTFCGTLRIQAVVREFIQSIGYYRAYLTNPELKLPSTTNTIESMCSLIRDLLRRNRCASSPQALLRWSTAQIRLRHTLICNGKNHQQN
jgi:hypothetical protein